MKQFFYKIFFPIFFLLSVNSFAQRIPANVIDTFSIRTGKIILYENNKWEYLDETIKDTSGRSNNKDYFDSEMLIDQGKTPYTKSQDSGKKKKSTEKNYTGGDVYIIKKGDTLMAVARKCGTTVNKLCALNNLTKTSKLSIGQKIKLK